MAKNKIEKISKGKIFSEFFTNLAVAWISAGLIAPIFTLSPYSFGSIFIMVVGTAVLVGSAIIFKELK